MVQQPDASLRSVETRRRRFEVAPPRRSTRHEAPWFDLDARRRVYALVVAVVCADGHGTSMLDAFLSKLRGKLGLTSETLEQPERLDLTDTLRELPRALRFLTLQLAIAGATVDGAVAPAGRAMLEEMATTLRLSKRFVSTRLTEALTRPRSRH